MKIRFVCELSKARKEEMVIVFLDAKAAFDRVNHALLLMMLCSIGSQRNYVKMVKGWLENKEMFPDAELGQGSDKIKLEYELNQGTIL